MQEKTIDVTEEARKLVPPDERRLVKLVREWPNPENKSECAKAHGAIGWLAKWGDLPGEIAGGGVRMTRKIADREQGRRLASNLASTMADKFGIAGPDINGAKFVIKFDPQDPRKMKVLEGFLKAFEPWLRTDTGTSGDLGVDHKDVLVILKDRKIFDPPIRHPQYGIVRGLEKQGVIRDAEVALKRLEEADERIIPKRRRPSSIHKLLVNLTAGWSVYVSTEYMLKEHLNKSVNGTTVAVQGVGAVGGSAIHFLQNKGAKIVAVSDKPKDEDPRVFDTRSIEAAEILRSIDMRTRCLSETLAKNLRRHKDPKGASKREILKGSQIFGLEVNCLIPAARSYAINIEIAQNIKAPLVIEGANDPIVANEAKDVNELLLKRNILVVPDFVANAGTAMLFTIGMMYMEVEMTEKKVLECIRQITEKALSDTLKVWNKRKRRITLREAAKLVSQNWRSSKSKGWKQFLRKP